MRIISAMINDDATNVTKEQVNCLPKVRRNKPLPQMNFDESYRLIT